MTLESEIPASRRGALVVVEGLDRAGKSTQCARLHQFLVDQGHKTKYIRFPGASRPVKCPEAILMIHQIELPPLAR